jgi:hypothetical protein
MSATPLNPVRGGLFIAIARAGALYFFLFVFRRRAHRQAHGMPTICPAPRRRKTKKEMGGWLGTAMAINRPPLTEFHPWDRWKACLWLRLCRAVLYRTAFSLRSFHKPNRLRQVDALPITNRRYSRFEICATHSGRLGELL